MRRDIGFLMIFDTLKKVKIFKDCDNNILYNIVLELKQEFFYPGQAIYQVGDPATHIYLIKTGCIAAMLKNGLEVRFIYKIIIKYLTFFLDSFHQNLKI